MPDALTSLAAAVSARVSEALAERTAAFEEVGQGLTDLVAPGCALLTGGKRLRAQLCGAGWLASGRPEVAEEPVVLAGSALELFQAAALVHDDVIDGSLTRRGMPAAHRAFATAHAERSWLGSADEYGLASAIVLGDLLLALSAAEVEAAGRAAARDGRAEAGARAHRIYDVMTAEVALGQYLDIRSQTLPWEGGDGRTPRELALEVVRHKSARYSVEHPLALGAALGGAEPEMIERLRAVGLPWGEAFQLRDDELGVFGDPEITGKPAGDDLREGKRTVLLAMTMERADAAGRDLLRGRVGAPDLSGEEVASLQALMRSTGAVAEHEELIAERHAAGVRALEAAGLPEPAEAALRRLAEQLVRRSA